MPLDARVRGHGIEMGIVRGSLHVSVDPSPPSPARPPIREELARLPPARRRSATFWLLSGLLFVLLGVAIGFFVRNRTSAKDRDAPIPADRSADSSGG